MNHILDQKKIVIFAALVAVYIGILSINNAFARETSSYPTLHQTTKIDGLDIFYREAGSKDAPKILLLHGFPTSSHMFRNLIPKLSDKYHVIAPDYPGFWKQQPAGDEGL